MNRLARLLPVVLVPMILELSSPTIQAGQLLPDQQHQVRINVGWSARYLAPMGQEFVPNNDSLDSVELLVANTDETSPGAADLVINIRQGDILGPVVGTSLPLTIPFNAEGIARFEFSSRVELVPGNHYVLEIVIAAGIGNIGVGGGWETIYAPGRAIIQGVPVPSTDNSDLWFREGTYRGGGKRSGFSAFR